MSEDQQKQLVEEDLSEFEPEYEPSAADDMFGEGTTVHRATNFLGSLKRLLGLMKPERVTFAFVVVLVAISVGLNVWAPKILGQATDVIFRGYLGHQVADQVAAQNGGVLPPGITMEQVLAQLRASGQNDFAQVIENSGAVLGVGIDFNELGMLLLTVMGMYLVANLMMWWEGWLLNRVVMRVIYRLRADVEDKLNRLPLSYYDTRQRGDVMSRVTNDVDNIQQALQQAFSQFIQSFLTVLGIGAFMFTIDWQLGLWALLAIPLSAVVVGLIGSRAQAKFKAQWKQTGAVNGQLEEAFSGMDLVRVFGRTEEMNAEFDQRNNKLYRASFSAQFISGSMFPALQFVTWLSYVVIAVAGALRVVSGAITVGEATAFIQYSREFSQPLTQMGGMANQVQSGVASAERTFELLDSDEQTPDDAKASLPARADGHVEFDGVSFSYDPETPLIEDLSLMVRPGQTVAIVGPTGAGKTTLVNLIMRFYELTGGRILLDDVNVTDLTRAELRSKVGMVLQDAWLFEGTIRENIRYGRLDATDEEIEAAAQATMVDRFVRQLPEGYDTVVSTDSGSISAGERQLITIARAFIADPSLLILDEATSSVDTRTEQLVQRAMNALRQDRTSFVIAHRLSTIRDADTIVVMEDGRIVEQGNHEALIQSEGAYYRLYMSQFMGALDDESLPEDHSGTQQSDPENVATAADRALYEDPASASGAGES